MDKRDRTSILEDLGNQDPEIRRLAVERLALLPAGEAIACLVDRLSDESWRVRKAAIERLASMPEASRATDSLIQALADGDNPGRRNAALDALVRCGPAAVPRLLQASDCDDVDVRKQVVDALAGIRDPRAVDRLIEMLQDADPNVRGASCDALGAIGDRGQEDLLTAARSDEERLVRLSALRSLARMEAQVPAGDLEAMLSDRLLQPSAFTLLGYTEDSGAVDHLLKGLSSSSSMAREAAMEALVRVAARAREHEIGTLAARLREVAESCPEIVGDVREGLASATTPAKLVRVQFLGLLQRADSVIPLLEAGRDEALAETVLATLASFAEVAERAIDEAWEELDEGLRLLACIVLGRCGGERGARRLGQAVAGSSSALRMAAARGLADRGSVSSLPLLVERLELAARSHDELEGAEELEVIGDAVVAIANSDAEADGPGRARAAHLLVGKLESSHEVVRGRSVVALGRIGRAEELDAVEQLLSDASAAVRGAAVVALAHLHPQGVPEALRMALADESRSVRVAAAGALAEISDPAALADLALLSRDEDARVRASAIRGLGRRAQASGASVSTPEAIAILERGLRDDESVALAAAQALHSVGGEPAVSLARGLLERGSPELIQAAIVCISTHGDAATLDALVPLITHADWSVRAEAISALAERGVVAALPAIHRRLENERDDFVRTAILRALKRLEG